MTSQNQTFRQHLLAQRRQVAGGSPISQAVADLADEIREALKEGDTYQVIAAALGQHMLAQGHAQEVVEKVTRKAVSEAARALGIYALPGRKKVAAKPVFRQRSEHRQAAVKPGASPAVTAPQPTVMPAAPAPAPAQPPAAPSRPAVFGEAAREAAKAKAPQTAAPPPPAADTIPT